MEEKKIKLTKADRFKMFLRSYFLLSSFNYERMQNGGWCYSSISAPLARSSSKARVTPTTGEATYG